MTGGPVARLLASPRAASLASLALLTALAWAWLAAGAGMGHGAQLLLDPFPFRTADTGDASMAMPMTRDGAWTVGRLALGFSMWWVMMVAMMLPAASPMVLLYARATRGGPSGASGTFLAGYLAIWGVFSLAAIVAQTALVQGALLAGPAIGSASRYLSAGVLLAIGLYQLSPAKNACLNQCRNPAEFLARFYRPGLAGAWRLGLIHGAWCVGCCWLLMALLFVGGVMNLAWIAVITLIVAAEKLLPAGPRIARLLGIVFLAWAAATALR